MTTEEMDALDKWIAENVNGWVKGYEEGRTHSGTAKYFVGWMKDGKCVYNGLFSPTRNEVDCAMVVDTMTASGFSLVICGQPEKGTVMWTCGDGGSDGQRSPGEFPRTLRFEAQNTDRKIATCLAVKEALESNEDT